MSPAFHRQTVTFRTLESVVGLFGFTRSFNALRGTDRTPGLIRIFAATLADEINPQANIKSRLAPPPARINASDRTSGFRAGVCGDVA